VYSKKTDTWALACVFIEVVTLLRPYGSRDALAAATLVAGGNLAPLDSLSPENACSDDLRAIIADCSQFDPAVRIGADDVVEQLTSLEAA
jgi:serine/threonine protein kinase